VNGMFVSKRALFLCIEDDVFVYSFRDYIFKIKVYFVESELIGDL